ncbi:MAG: hypothetical protein JOY61_05755, partial [Chloroflexi bacterium]|nr:hypothetical protein [Chloroflexota bacterium]
MLAQRPAKTLSARQYAQWDLIESYVEMPFRGLPPEGLACRSVVYTPPVYNTPRQLGHDLRRLTHGLSLAVWQAHVP